MEQISRRNVGIILALLVVLILSACSGDSSENTKDNGDVQGESTKTDLKIRTRDDPDFLDPHLMEASITEQILLNVFEGLLAPETDGTLKPAIAEKYNISEDGLTYTFKIRENVVFHNGDPVTVEDIKYTFERLTGLNGEEALTSDFESIESIEISDDTTFILTLSQVNSTFLAYLTGKDSAIIPESNEGLHNETPIGTGPFKFSDYSPGSKLVLEKNEDYWVDGIPYLEEVTFVFQVDDETALMAFQSGEIDLLEIPPHRIPEVENDYQLIYQENNSMVIIGYNQEEKPFNDLKVRQAINYAINKDDVIEATFSSYATKIGSNMSPAMGPYYKDGLEDKYAIDVDKAKKLLAEAGYPDGFSTTISISSHTQRYADIAQVAVENLKEIGIDVEIEVVEWGVWLERIYQGREYEMTAIDFTGKLSPYDILDRYISDNSNNFVNFENKEFDQLMADVLKEENLEKQIEVYHRAQEILSEEAAAVFIADYQFIWVMDKKLEGYKTYPMFFIDLSELRFKE